MSFTLRALLLSLLFTLNAEAGTKRVCYDSYGCFNDATSFDLPWEPARINTTFRVYNRANGYKGEAVKQDSVNLASFDCLNSNTVFIVHGFKLSVKRQWTVEMKEAILKAQDVNVIMVDWSSANQHPYSQAAGNAQIVAIEIAKLILSFVSELRCAADRFHLVGFSLGAHIAGNAGQRVKGLGRITALDPASVYFEDVEDSMRLDKSDAQFVDVIHTDSSSTLGFGMKRSLGHVDFYPNGGKNQAGCPSSNKRLLDSAWALLTDSAKSARSKYSCSHKAAYRLFIDSLATNCSYTAYACANYKTFKQGRCLECPESGCNRMGYWASKERQLGNLYLSTKPTNTNETRREFCQEHFKVRLLSNNLDGQTKAKGKFQVSFKTAGYQSGEFLVGEKGIVLEPHMETTTLIRLDEILSEEIEEVLVYYKRTSNYLVKYLYDQSWSFKYVEVTNGRTQQTIKFCPLLQMIKSGTTVMFKKC